VDQPIEKEKEGHDVERYLTALTQNPYIAQGVFRHLRSEWPQINERTRLMIKQGIERYLTIELTGAIGSWAQPVDRPGPFAALARFTAKLLNKTHKFRHIGYFWGRSMLTQPMIPTITRQLEVKHFGLRRRDPSAINQLYNVYKDGMNWDIDLDLYVAYNPYDDILIVMQPYSRTGVING